MPIRILIFDLDNTLISWQHAVKEACAALAQAVHDEYKVDTEHFLKYWTASYALFTGGGTSTGNYDRGRTLVHAFDQMSIPIDPQKVDGFVDLFWEVANQSVTIYPYTVATLDRMRKKYTTCIMSDSDGLLRYKMSRIDRFDLARYVDRIFTTDTTGYMKPHPLNFRMIMDAFKVAGDECVMIGDHPTKDMRGAKVVGMHTILSSQARLQMHPPPPEEPDIEYADHIIKDIADVPHAVEMIERRLMREAISD